MRARQINFVFWGFAISIGNAIVINLFLQSFYPVSLEISRVGLYGMPVLVALSSYAIIRRQFFDMRQTIVRAVAFLMFIILIGTIYSLLFAYIFDHYINAEVSPSTYVWFSILTVVAMLSFQPIYRSLARLTDRIFFKAYYNKDALLLDLTHILASTLDLQKITEDTSEILCDKMKISKAAFLILENGTIADVHGSGYFNDKSRYIELEKIFQDGQDVSHPFIYEDVSEGSLKNLFREREISVAIPMQVEKEKVAILILGSKLSGERYHQLDVELLSLFASEAGIAIQNARNYARLKEFSQELEEKVDERTRELKESQERELDKALEVARLKDEFVFIAAHELRTPVTAIKGFMELVSPALEKFPKDIKENLQAISVASDHLNQLVAYLLDIARSQADVLTVDVAPIEVVPILRKQIKEQTPLADKKQVKIELQVEKSEMVYGDSVRLSEVFMNLLANAIKYNKDRGYVYISVFPQESNLIIEFRDTGYGIPKDQQGRIFQKFFRAPTSISKGVLGTGLGLFISRMLIEKMGGKIMFSSVENKGTTFAISLPIFKNN